MKILYLKDPFEEDNIEGDEEDEDDDHADEHRDVLGAVQLVSRPRCSTPRSDRGRDTCQYIYNLDFKEYLIQIFQKVNRSKVSLLP